MAQIKISELELNTQISNEDVLAGVDTSEQKTKKFKLETLKTFINKEQDEQITKNKNDISANATNIETNAENISKNSENIEKNAQDIVENKDNIADNTNRTKRIENTLYDSGEASGSSINIKDSTLAEFQEISVDGVCKQVTTQGYNLIKNEYIKSTGVENKPNTELLKSGVYTLAMCDKIAFDSPIYIRLWKNGEMVATDSHITNINNWSISGFSNVTYNYYGTALSGTNYISFNIDDEYELEITTLNASGTRRVTLVSGDKPIYDFEPYSGGVASPSSEYPQNIEVIDEGFDVVSCGKNLFNKDNKVNYYININKLDQLNDGYSYYVKVKPNSSYTFKRDTLGTNSRGYIALANKFPSVGDEVIVLTSDMNVTNFTFNTYGDTKYIILFLNRYATDEVGENIQLVEGIQATEFEPYQETRVPINLPDGEFVGKLSDTIKDQVRIAFNEEDGQTHAYLDKKIKKYTFTGDETFYSASANGTVSSYYCSIFNDKKVGIKNFKCNQFLYKGDAQNNSTLGYAMAFNSVEEYKRFMYIQVPSDVVAPNDATGFNAWFKNIFTSENPCVVYYELEEPYEVDLGVVDMPLSYSPETNVFTTSELEAIINAEYYRNFINTIQNLQVNEKALQQELIDINSRLSALETNLVNLANVESEVVE